MRPKVPRELLLAVVPRTHGIAYAYFEGPLSAVDWGIKETRRPDNNSQGLAALCNLVEHLQPDVLILEDYVAHSVRRSARTRRLQQLIASYAAAQAIEVTRYTRTDIRAAFALTGAVTRYEIAQIIAGRVHAFSFRLPPVRKLWKSEDSRMALFDAAALAFTHFSQRGIWPNEPF